MKQDVARFMCRGSSAVLLLAIASSIAVPAMARDVLGVFNRWGAFRDAPEARCYAVAEPIDWRDPKRIWSPFASIGFWPRQQVRGQVSITLSRALQKDSMATLVVGAQRFQLSGKDANVWAKDRQDDAAIVAALRSGGTMSVHGRASSGQTFADHYELRGAATAIDAAALGCARLR